MGSADDRLLTRREVEKLTSLGRSAIYRSMRDGRFPSPLRVGVKSVRWRQSEIAAWIDALPRANGEG